MNSNASVLLLSIFSIACSGIEDGNAPVGHRPPATGHRPPALRFPPPLVPTQGI